MRLLKRYLAIQDAIGDWLGKIISWLVVCIVAILIFEIGARYLFGSPTSWAHELSTMVYGGFCVLAMAYTQRHDAHVRSDVIYNRFSPRWKNIVDLLTASIILVVLAIFFKLALDFAATSWRMGEMSYRSTWQPPIYPFKAMLPLGVGLLFLQTLAKFVRDICNLAGIDTETA